MGECRAGAADICATLRHVKISDAQRVQLHHDYLAVCDAGIKRRPTDAAQLAAVERLAAAGLLLVEGDYLTMQRPEYGTAGFPESSLVLLMDAYARWLHAEQVSIGEQLLFGQTGFWQHWWNLLHEQIAQDRLPLRMDLVMADRPGILAHDWMDGFRADLLQDVLAGGALAARVLLPPCDSEGPLGEVAGVLVESGFGVRVRSSPFLFAVYGGEAAVISDGGEASADRADSGTARIADDGYFLTRRASIVTPLQRVFDEQWAQAVQWHSYTRGAADVLELMSLGWTDARIAEAMGLSKRTVTRRVSEAMAAAGVSSRFELGIRYARSKT